MANKFPIFSFFALQFLFRFNLVTSFTAPYIHIWGSCQYSEQCVVGPAVERELKNIPYSERHIRFGACNISTGTCCDQFGPWPCHPRAILGSGCHSDMECRYLPGICSEAGICVCDLATSFPSAEGIRANCTCNPGTGRSKRPEDCADYYMRIESKVPRCNTSEMSCLATTWTCESSKRDPREEEGYCRLKCRATDPYGQEWEGTSKTTVRRMCPFGKPDREAKWFCGENGQFNGSSPDYWYCSSEWVGDILDKIYTPVQLEFVTATNLCQEIAIRIKSAHIDSHYNIYSHELAPLLMGLKSIAQKFVLVPIAHDNLNLVRSILTCVDVMLKYEQPWVIQTEIMKSQTFSSLLDTLENVPLYIATKACYTNGSSFKCKLPFVFNSTELGHILKMENATKDVGIQSKSEQIRGQKSSLKITLPTEKELLWVGSSLSSKYTRAYSTQQLASESSSVVKRLKGDNYQTNADLMTFTVANLRERLDTANLSVEITLWHSEYAWSTKPLQIQRRLHSGEKATFVQGSAQCVFWDADQGAWSSKGCRVTSSTSFSTTCVCNHLSVFSLMMKAHSYIGKSAYLLTISLIIVLLLVAYLVAKIVLIKRRPSTTSNNDPNSPPDRSQLLKNFGLVLTLGVYGLIFFFVDKHYFSLPTWACYGTGMMAHFIVHWAVLVLTLEFLVATVDYISLKGFYFILMRTTRNPNQTLIGIPFWIAIFSVAIVTILDQYDGPDSMAYGGAFCWIDKPFVGSLFIPLWILLAFNYFLLVLVLGEAVGALRQQKRTLPSGMGREAPVGEVITFAKNGLITNTLVTSTWIIAYFHLGPHDKESKFLSYLFPMVFVLQGILIERLMDKEALVNKLKMKLVNCLLVNKVYQSQGKVHNVQEPQGQLGSGSDPQEKVAMLPNRQENTLVPKKEQVETKELHGETIPLQKKAPVNNESILKRCLDRIGCGEYISVFIDNDIDLNCFKTLTKEELGKLLEGKIGPVKKIYAEIQRIRGIDERKRLEQNSKTVFSQQEIETKEDGN